MNSINRFLKRNMFLPAFLLLAVLSFEAGAITLDTVGLSVLNEKAQTFYGFGMHQGRLRYAEKYADTIANLVVKDLKLTHARMYPMTWSSTDPDLVVKSLEDYDTTYMFRESGKYVWDYWKEVNPNLMWICSFGLNRISGPVAKDTTRLRLYCDTICELINTLAEQRDMHFSWVGIVNEPNDTKEGILDTIKTADGRDSVFVQRRVAPEMYPELVKIMRRSLIAHGLDTMKIMGPEVSSVDNVCYEYLQAVEADSEAMAAFQVLFSKAYNMCASKEMKAFALRHNLPYLAAAGANTIEGKQSWMQQFPYENSTDNTHYAADLAARILNDLNHGVTHWASYFNVQEFYHVETSHRLIWPFASEADAMGTIEDPENGMLLGPDLYLIISLKYYYLKHLAHTLDVGGVFRDTRITKNLPAATSDDMFYTYGRKPDIVSASLLNPDSTMTVAVVNLTGATSDTAAVPRFTYGDSVSYTVNVDIEELAAIPKLSFDLIRSNKTLRLTDQDSITMTNGTMSFTIEPLELVTLRSGKIDMGVGIASRQSIRFDGVAATAGAAGGHVSVSFNRPGDYRIGIVRADGAAVVPGRMVRRASAGTYRFPIAHLPAGVYILKIDSEGMQKTQRILVRD